MIARNDECYDSSTYYEGIRLAQAHAEFREGKLIGMYSGHVRSVLKTKMHTYLLRHHVHPSVKSNIEYEY